MRTTLDIEDHLLIEAKQIAARTGRTLTAVVEDALRFSLQKREEPGERKPLNLPTFGGSGFQPGVNLDSNADTLDRMDGLL